MRFFLPSFIGLTMGLFIMVVPIYSQTNQFVAVVGALDKITARVTQLELPKDRIVQFGTLRITARACYTRPPTEPPETYIYLEIEDVLADGRKEQVFTGWMLASSPALHALEHAVYDVWAISCKISSGDASSPNA